MNFEHRIDSLRMEVSASSTSQLSAEQLKLKRRLMHRHAEERPTLIGYSTPLEIHRMIRIKEKRSRKKSKEDIKNPKIELLQQRSVKRRKNSPDRISLLPSIKSQNRRYNTEISLHSESEEKLNVKKSSIFLKLKSNVELRK